MNKIKKYRNLLFLQLIFNTFLLILLLENKKKYEVINKDKKYTFNEKIKFNYKTNNFIIVKLDYCRLCGLFSYFQVGLGCINYFINQGYIPIIDINSFPNIFNGFNPNSSKSNPWELFFNQPYGFELDKVLKNVKKLAFSSCSNKGHSYPSIHNIYGNKVLLHFWHNIVEIYLPIKNEIKIKLDLIIKKLFNNSKNILGILMRGTDFISIRPKNHCIPPTPELVFNDIKKMNKTNKYEYLFLATEDEYIKEKFLKKFNNKLKYLKQKKIEYNYTKKEYIACSKNITGNIENLKIYLLNVLILSKCLDIIVSRTSGAVGAFILSKGFRKEKVYNLGIY